MPDASERASARELAAPDFPALRPLDGLRTAPGSDPAVPAPEEQRRATIERVSKPTLCLVPS